MDDSKNLVRRLPIFYAVVTVMFIILFWSTLPFFRINTNDIPNASSLILEIGFGIAITWTVFVYSKRDQDKITELLKYVSDREQKQEEREKEIREDVSRGLNGRLDVVIQNLNQCLHLSTLRDRETDPTRKANFANSMSDNYDRSRPILNLDINIIELMQIFGRATARQYWGLLSKLSIHSSVYGLHDDANFPAFVSHVNECIVDCNSLKAIIEPLASNTVRLQN